MKLSLAWIAIIVGFSQSPTTLYSQITYEPYGFSLFAGAVQILGSDDGTGTAARFNGPQGAAIDSSGNIYIADAGSFTIRKISPGAVVTTLAGFAGSAGISDGTGSSARFDLPQGVAVDSTGNVYVGDSQNDTIRKITAAGVVTTLAGVAGQIGSDDGPGSTARFSYPIGVTVDPAGNVYVVDEGNDTIRTITPGGVVSTLAGSAGNPGSADGTGNVARFYVPRCIAWDKTTGVLYLADTGNNTIRRITLAGAVTTFAGSAGSAGTSDGTGSAARFNSPAGITVDGVGNVYVTSIGSHTIRKITPAAVVTTLAGSPGASGSADGVGSIARFDTPRSLVADNTGHLFVTDTNNQTIRFGRPFSEILSLKISRQPNGNKLLTGNAFPSASVNILAAADLGSAFQPLTTVTAGPDGVFQYEDTAAPKRFYQASVSSN